jgi:HAD superfamily hydrolase (TIGR01490 family)
MTDDAAMPDQTLPVAAFFDVDKTLVNGASLLFLARAARSLGIVSWRDILKFGLKAASFRRKGESLSVLDEVRDRGMRLLAGQRAERLHALAEQVVSTMQPRIWPETRALLLAHLDAGHEVYLISATPDFLAQELAQTLGATAGIGSGLEIRDGIFTGHFTSGTMHGAEKARAAQAIMAERGLNPADCYAYSDSSNDLPLLSAVGTAVAVNPDHGLARHARESGWRILQLDPASIRAERKRVRAASRAR